MTFPAENLFILHPTTCWFTINIAVASLPEHITGIVSVIYVLVGKVDAWKLKLRRIVMCIHKREEASSWHLSNIATFESVYICVDRHFLFWKLIMIKPALFISLESPWLVFMICETYFTWKLSVGYLFTTTWAVCRDVDKGQESRKMLTLIS